MRRSNKNNYRATETLRFQITQGLDYSLNPAYIKPENASRLHNFLYEKGSATPIVRPAIKQVTLDSIGADITSLFHWIKDASTEYTLCIANNELYYLDRARAGFAAWVVTTAYVVDDERKNDGKGYICILAHTSSTNDEPGGTGDWKTYWREDPLWIVQNAAGFAVDSSYRARFLAFNQKCLIASGDQGLQYWDGPGSYGTITTGVTTIHPTVITEIGNRVVINGVNSGAEDAVFFSKIEDHTGWTFTSVGGAVLIRTEFGSGMNVNAFGVFGNDLIVSKASAHGQHLTRIAVGGDAYVSGALTWKVKALFHSTGAKDYGIMENMDSQVAFISQQGVELITGSTPEYTELSIQPIGLLINNRLKENDQIELKYLPALGSLWIVSSGTTTVHLWHPWAGFTALDFDAEVGSVAQRDDNVLIAKGEYLYEFATDDSTTDENPNGDDPNVYGVLRTKRIESIDSRTLVKAVEVNYVGVTSGTLSVDYVIAGITTNITEATLFATAPQGYEDFYLWQSDFFGSTHDFLGTSESTVLRTRGRKKVEDFALQVRTAGRCQINSIDCVYVIVN